MPIRTMIPIEKQDVMDLEAAASQLTPVQEVILIQSIIEQTCWHGPVTREWLEKEIKSLKELNDEKSKQARLALSSGMIK